MVIGDLHVVGITIIKAETDTPLVVDTNRVLAIAVRAKAMEPVAWRYTQVVDPRCNS